MLVPGKILYIVSFMLVPGNCLKVIVHVVPGNNYNKKRTTGNFSEKRNYDRRIAHHG
jgi:hypothetical protein